MIAARIASAQTNGTTEPPKAPVTAPGAPTSPTKKNSLQARPAPSPELEKKLYDGVDTSNRRELSDQELLEKFFKKPQNQSSTKNQKKTKVYFPIFYESMSQPLTQIEVTFDTTITGIENLKMDASALIQILEELVDKSWMPKIDGLKQQCAEILENKENRLKELRNEKKVDPMVEDIKCWAEISKVTDDSVIVVFIENKLEIRIKVKPELRSVKIASLTNTIRSAVDTTDKPSWFSSYLNMNFNQTFQSDNTLYKNGREPITGRYESGTRIGPVVIEAEGRSTEKRTEVETIEPDFVRESTRLVLDFPSLGARTQIGDLTFPIGPYQSFRSQAGVSFFTKASLRNSQLTLPGTNYDLNLARRSKVAVYINDKLTQVLELPAGRHNLRDFPFVSGKNELKLEITNDIGQTEIQTYSLLLTSALLKKGEHDVSYSYGAPSTQIRGTKEYDQENLTTTLYHRYGFSHALTLGAAYQANKLQSLTSIETLFSTPLGYFSIIPALSTSKAGPSGNALGLRYVMDDSVENKKMSSTTSFELRSTSSNFASVGELNPVNTSAINFLTTHSRSLSEKTTVNVSFGYDVNRETSTPVNDSYSLSLGSGQKWMKELSTNISFRHSHGATGKDDVSINFFLIWSMPSEKQFVTASSSDASSSRIDWTKYSVGGVGAHKARVNYQRKSDGPSYGGDIEYSGNRVNLNAAHQIDIENEDPTTTPPTEARSVHTTNLQLGTALVFAGGHFGISKPVYDSFVMFVPLKNLKKNDVLVNLQKDGSFIAKTDFLGTAVASETPSYYNSNFKISQTESQRGVSLPKDHFVVQPTYKSGYAIEIGTTATVYLKTKLLGPEGNPVSMIVARAVYLDDDDIEPVTVFTNRAGLVRSEGFRNGRYRLEFPDGDFESVDFVIPDSAEDDFELPALNLKESAN